VELLPADLPHGIPPAGLSIHGDPVAAAEEALALDFPCLELRPRDFSFSRPSLDDAIDRWRGRGPRYLSYHLPNLTWNPDAGRIEGEEAMRDHLSCALDAGVESLTAHVPRATSLDMGMDDGCARRPTDAWRTFEDATVRLFEEPVRSGVRLAIENIHNPRGTPAASPNRSFTTRIDEYLLWIDTVSDLLCSGGNGAVGALLDVGHARNNGGELDNLQPLGDWYARVGKRILGYHIHQVDVSPQTGKLSNHLAIENPFGPRISYAGFLWAWSTRQTNRAPIFVEIRDEAGRRETVVKLLQLFREADRITHMADIVW
jgi:sugar phosphate isomerase/epimerase